MRRHEPPLWWWNLSYWLRPFDGHLDARRWRWQTPGCVRSRRALRELANEAQEWGTYDQPTPTERSKGNYQP